MENLVKVPRQETPILKGDASEQLASGTDDPWAPGAISRLPNPIIERTSSCYIIFVETSPNIFRVEETNPAARRAYDWRLAQMVGHTVDECLGHDDAPLMTSHLRACIASSTRISFERTYNGCTLAGAAYPLLHQSGENRRVLVIETDITERRLLRRQLRQARRMEAVGQLTIGLVHDFNNVLAGIIGSLEALQARAAEGRVSELGRYIDRAKDWAKRGATTARRLLTFSRREDSKATDAGQLIGQMHSLIKEILGPSITLEIVAMPDLWETLMDPHQFESALLNLCANARDAMPDGGKLTIEMSNIWLDRRAALNFEVDSGEFVSVSVSDTGTGMAHDVAAHAFEPFFTTKSEKLGTGLGLAMVYGFVKQSGGHVQIVSDAGYGTMICMYLPRHV